jgi:hypothetical protein
MRGFHNRTSRQVSQDEAAGSNSAVIANFDRPNRQRPRPKYDPISNDWKIIHSVISCRRLAKADPAVAPEYAIDPNRTENLNRNRMKYHQAGAQIA